jgi:acetyl esterase/lipase
MRRFRPEVEPCESRVCPTLVFIFPGNALAAASPDIPTQTAADQLLRAGDQPIQVSTPALDSPGAFYAIADYVRRISQGQPIGLMGFSAGGALALHLADQPGLNVQSVMDYYGPPDLDAWLASHGHDYYYQYVASHVHLTSGVEQLLSGPTTSKANFVGAFGLEDPNVLAGVSTAAFQRDFPNGQSFEYEGPHGVTLWADYAAYQDFLDHLGPSTTPDARNSGRDLTAV